MRSLAWPPSNGPPSYPDTAFWYLVLPAGWGGCAVSLVPNDKLESFLAAMKAGYYAAREWPRLLCSTVDVMTHRLTRDPRVPAR